MNLHALLVAINNYPNPRHILDGCVNDLREFEAFLRAYYPEANIKTLIDHEAKRQNVIDALLEFEKAEDGDTCLFFYAGHGSRSPAPEVFWPQEPDQLLESLVCWDSRTENGYDLMDKELSYLVWKITHSKNIHFVSITDCCHSGSNMRVLETGKERRTSNSDRSLPLDKFYGYEEYEQQHPGKYPPRGSYVHLAAARANQTAKEVRAKGQPRGAFSYCLVDALKDTHGQLSYAELLTRIRGKVEKNVAQQVPQLEVMNLPSNDLFFLTGTSRPGPRPYLVHHEKQFGWVVDAGALHGITEGDEQFPTIFELEEDEREVTVVQTYTDRSKVIGMKGMDEGTTYKAFFKQGGIVKLTVAFADGSDQQGTDQIRQLLTEKPSDLVVLSDSSTDASYWIHAKNGMYYLTTTENPRPLFKRVEGYTEEAAFDFLKKIEVVASWNQILNLSKAESRIREEEIEIEILRTTEPGDYSNQAAAEPLDLSSDLQFTYLKDQAGEWHEPAFRLKIKNTGTRNLWVSLLYLANDFSIGNDLINKEELAPDTEIWALEIDQGERYLTIPLRIEDYYREWGLTSITEYFKVIVSTQEFDTDRMNQEGLEPERFYQPTRGRGRIRPIQIPDWRTFTLALSIHCPLPAVSIHASEAPFLFGNQLQAPAGFQANMALRTLEELEDLVVQWDLASGQRVSPIELGPLESLPGLCVIELSGISRWEHLQLLIPNSISIPETYIYEIQPITGELAEVGKIDPSTGIADLQLTDRMATSRKLLVPALTHRAK